MTILEKSYSDWTKVEKSAIDCMSYEGLGGDDEVKTVPELNKNNRIII